MLGTDSVKVLILAISKIKHLISEMAKCVLVLFSAEKFSTLCLEKIYI